VCVFSLRPTGNFVWSGDHDIVFCREVLVSEPYRNKPRSTERAKAWENIAKNLNNVESPKFKVTVRSVRDHYTQLTNKKAQQLREEEKASGIEVTPTELDVMLEEILEKEKVCKAEIESGEIQLKKNAEKEKLSAENIRRQAMERMSETKKREEDDDEESPTKKKKTRRSSHEMFEFLEQKLARDYTMKQEDLEFRKNENEAVEKRERDKLEVQEKREQQQHELMVTMMRQQQQQQQQVQDLQAMFIAQQKQQTEAMMNILKNANKN
jgi:hypothetical protein